jgi:hypothetical protein
VVARRSVRTRSAKVRSVTRSSASLVTASSTTGISDGSALKMIGGSAPSGRSERTRSRLADASARATSMSAA